MHPLKAVAVVAGAVMVLIVGTRLADVRPPVPAGPPSLPAPPAPQPAALRTHSDAAPPMSAAIHDAPRRDPASPLAAPIDAPLTVSGTVVDEDGRPVAGASVWGPVMKRSVGGSCYPGIGFMVETDAEGRFLGTLRGAPPASVRGGLLHMVSGGGCLPASIPAPEGAWEALDAGRSVAGLRVVLQRGAAVEGTVRDGDGRTVSGAVVRFLPSGGEVPGDRLVHAVKTDAAGAYRYALLDPRERWFLRAEFLGRGSPALPLENLLHPDGPLSVDLDIPDLHRARIRVRDEGAFEETLLFLDEACEGEGTGEDGARSWEVEALVGLHIVELWNGADLRIRETVELGSPGETVCLEIDGGGRVRRVPLPGVGRGCRMPPGEVPPDSRPPEDPPPPPDN